MPNGFNEVKTVFTLDRSQFESGLDKASASIEEFKARLSGASKESTFLKSSFESINRVIQSIGNKDIDMSTGIRKAQADLARFATDIGKLESKMDSLKIDIQTKDIDLTMLGKVKSLINEISNMKLIDSKSIIDAQNEAKQLKKEIDKLDNNVKIDVKLNADVRALRSDIERVLDFDVNLTTRANAATGFGGEDSLRHWIDNNSSALNQESDDLQRTLREILGKVSQIVANRQAPQDHSVENKLIDTNNKLIDALKGMREALNRPDEVVRNSSLDSSGGLSDNVSDAVRDNYDLIVSSLEQMRDIKEQMESADEAELRSLRANLEMKRTQMAALATMMESHVEISDIIALTSSDMRDTIVAIRESERELDAINQQLRELDGSSEEYRENLEQQSEECRGQIRLLGYTNEERRNLLTLMTQEEHLQQTATDEVNEYVDALRRGNNEAEQAPKIFGKILDVLRPITDFLGLGDSKLLGIIQNLGGASTESAGAIGELVGGLTSTEVAMARASRGAGALSASFVAITAVVAAVVAGIVVLVATIKGLISLYTKAINTASEFEDSLAKLGAQLGLTNKELESTQKLLKDGFSQQGYTNSVEEYANALKLVKQALKGVNQELTDAQAMSLTDDVLAVSKVTDYDPNEIVRAQQRMMINLKMSAEDALDMIMRAYQTTGDLNNDLLDTFSEYSSQFSKLGLSANWFYGLLNAGAQAGVMNTDKVADAAKELYLRMADGSDVVIESLNKLGLRHSVLIQDFNAGGPQAEAAFGSIITAIAGVQNEAEKSNIIAALLGAPGEDVGNHFFTVLSEAQTGVDEFKGSVQEARDLIENTFSYQLTELGNIFKAIFDDIGSEILPILKSAVSDVREEMDTIRAHIQEVLVPALFELFGVMTIAFNLDDVTSYADMVIMLIDIVAGLIRSFVTLVNVLRKVGAAIGLVWNIATLFVKSFMLGLSTISIIAAEMIVAVVNGFTQLGLGVVGVAEGMVRAFDDAFMLIVKGVANMGIGLINGMTWAAKSAANAFLKYALNPIIKGYNSTVGKIPGVDAIGEVGSFDTSSSTIKYISMAKEFSGLKNAFGKDNAVFGAMDEIQSSFNNKYKSMASQWANDSKGLADSIMKDFDDISRDLNTLTQSPTQMGKDLRSKLTSMVEEGKLTATRADGVQKEMQQYFNNMDKKYEGTEKTAKQKADDARKSADSAKKAADNAKKASDALKKAADDAASAAEEIAKAMESAYDAIIKSEQEAHNKYLDYLKRRIDAEKKAMATNRKFEEVIFDQSLKIRGESDQAIRDQIEFITHIKKAYILSADELIGYTNQQLDLAIKLRDSLSEKMKKSLEKDLENIKASRQKEIDALKKDREAELKQINLDKDRELQAIQDAKDKELKILKDANDDQLDELRKQLRAINDLMRENEYNWNREDDQNEIKDLEKELQKYIFATSYEGIRKRNELEKALAEKREQVRRKEITKELEDEKIKLEDKITEIENKADVETQAIEDKYDEQRKIAEQHYESLITLTEEKYDAQVEAIEAALEAAEALYDQKYQELQDMFEDKENLLANIRKMAMLETNDALRAEMNQFATDYEDSLKRMSDATVSMQQLQNWRIQENKREWEEANLLEDQARKDQAHWDAEDARKNGGTIPVTEGNDKSNLDKIGEVLNPDYLKIKELQREWNSVNRGANAKADDKAGKIKQDMLHAEANKIRAKWGLKYPNDPPKMIPKFHTGGVVKDYFSKNGEVEALLQPGEVVLTNRKFNDLMTLLDSVNLTSMSPSLGNLGGGVTVNNSENYNGPMIQIDTVNNNNNTDMKRFSNEMEVLASRKSRSKGVRIV